MDNFLWNQIDLFNTLPAGGSWPLSSILTISGSTVRIIDNLVVSGSIQVTTGSIGIVLSKSDTGDPATGTEGLFCINTFDNNVKIYADGAWRSLANW